MKLLRIGEPGFERPCVEFADGSILDVGDRFRDFGADFFANGGLEDIRSMSRQWARSMDSPMAESRRVGAPIAQPGKIVCIGQNYRRHVEESGAEMPSEPVVFMKSPSTLVGPNDEILIPPFSVKTDWEIELGVIIGQRAVYLRDESEARRVIAGYAISNDISERHFQLERGGQWVKGKSFDTFNPLGPWLLTSDEIGDVSELEMELKVNGEVRQHSSIGDMIFPVEHLIWYVSQFMALEPGDLVNTGTPAGVGLGMSPPTFLTPGDVMELTIDELGTQRQTCRAAP